MESTMKGLWLEDRKITFRTDLPLPKFEADEVLIKLLLRGVCEIKDPGQLHLNKRHGTCTWRETRGAPWQKASFQSSSVT